MNKGEAKNRKQCLGPTPATLASPEGAAKFKWSGCSVVLPNYGRGKK